MAWLANIGSFIANSKAAKIFLAVLGVILAFKTVQWKARMEGEKEANRKNEREALKEQARVDQTRREITKDNQDAIERADEAVSTMPRYRHSDELRRKDPGLASVVLGDGEGNG